MCKTLLMIRFGIVIPQEGVEFSAIRDIAHQCENLGFNSIWLCDHVFWSSEPFLECWTCLSALASETKNLRLGTLVINTTLRPPPLLAKMAATLDVITGGRLEFGIGAGTTNPREYLAYESRLQKARRG